jgi:hypothetical protein
MSRMRSAVLAAMVATGFVGAGVTTAGAEFQPSAEDRSACDKDAFKLCMSSLPSKEAVMLCLRGKKAELSPRCRAQFDKRGG